MNHSIITRQDVERALKKDPRGVTGKVRFEVTYHDRTDHVTYDAIGQINFDRVKKIVLVFPKGSGPEFQPEPGTWSTKDRKKVRG
jgi:hypothetical protein